MTSERKSKGSKFARQSASQARISRGNYLKLTKDKHCTSDATTLYYLLHVQSTAMAYPRRRSLSLDDGDFDRNSGSRMPSHRHLPGEPSQHDGYPAQSSSTTTSSISPLAPPPSATAASAMGGLYSSLYSVIFSLVHLVLTVVLSPVIKTAHAPHQKTSPTLRSEQQQQQQPEHDDDGSRGSHGDLCELEAGNYPTSAVGSGSGMTSISSYNSKDLLPVHPQPQVPQAAVPSMDHSLDRHFLM